MLAFVVNVYFCSELLKVGWVTKYSSTAGKPFGYKSYIPRLCSLSAVFIWCAARTIANRECNTELRSKAPIGLKRKGH